MRKHLRDALSIVAAIAVVLLSIGVSVVFADPSAVLMKTGDAEVGKTIKISVKVSGDGPYGGYNGSISVDSSYFEIVSISAGNYGAANFSKGSTTFLDYNCNIPSDSTIVVIELKCLQAGSSVVSTSLEVSSLDGLNSYSTGASASIEIKEPVALSTNNYLSALTVSPGSLSPAFSKDTLNYSVTVNDSVTSIAITATAEDAGNGAKVSLNGVQNDLKPGENTVKVTVTAANGDTRTYVIKVTRGTPTPTPEPYPLIGYNGANLTILEKGTLENVPSGFSWSETTYSGKAVPCLVGPDGTLLMWLLSDSGKALYVYDLNTQTVSPCYGFDSSAVHYLFISFPQDFTAPAGYEKTTMDIGENTVDAYVDPSDSTKPMLVYLIDGDGHVGLYYMDKESGLVMPFRGDMQNWMAEPTPVPTETPVPTDTPTPAPTATMAPVSTTPAAKDGVDPIYKTATITLAVMTTLFLILAVVLIILRQSDKTRMLTDYYDEEELEEELPDQEEESDDEQEEAEEEENEEETDPVEEASAEHKDFYYQFGDDPDMPPAPKEAPKKDGPKPEDKKIILDFPPFPGNVDDDKKD